MGTMAGWRRLGSNVSVDVCTLTYFTVNHRIITVLLAPVDGACHEAHPCTHLLSHATHGLYSAPLFH